MIQSSIRLIKNGTTKIHRVINENNFTSSEIGDRWESDAKAAHGNFR